MTNFLFLVSLIFFTACSSFNKSNIFEIAKSTKYSVVKKTAVQNEDEARKVMQTRYNYLTVLFEQSRDPYYGHPKWSESCLQANKIGIISKANDPIMSVSELYVDGKGNPGFCPESLYVLKAYEISFYCENEKSIYQITLPQSEKLDLKKVSLCK